MATQTPARDLSAADLMSRATAAVPMLAEHARETDEGRRIPDVVMDHLQGQGLLSACSPRRYGGSEQDWHLNVDLCAELARGCGSTAWVASVHNVAGWIVALFPERAQDEVWGADPDARACGVLIPRRCTARRTDDGYVVEDGMWGFGSGSVHAKWAVFNTPVTDEAGQLVDQVLALVPMSDVEIQDDWYTTAMRGTSSNGLVLRDVHVPAHRTVSAAGLIAGQHVTPHDAPLFHAALVPSFAISITGPVIGLAQAALDHTVARVGRRPIQYTTYATAAEATVTQEQVAIARLKIDGALLHVHRAADEVMRYAEAGEPMPVEARIRAKADCGWATRLAGEAGELLVAASGASSIAEADPMQRVMRDLRGVVLHGLLLPTTNVEALGRQLCDQPLQTTMV